MPETAAPAELQLGDGACEIQQNSDQAAVGNDVVRGPVRRGRIAGIEAREQQAGILIVIEFAELDDVVICCNNAIAYCSK